MSDMNNNERGRITGMPGTTTTVVLHPQRLGVRMRNSIIRMLENRALTGGWSSKSRQIATALVEKYGIQCSNNDWNGLQIIGLSEAAAPSVAEIVHADWTAWILEHPEYRNGYYNDHHDRAMECISNLDNKFFVMMHDKESTRKVTEILAEHTSQELKDKAKHVADLLRGTEPIEITTFQE
jgi:hypothetical protein